MSMEDLYQIHGEMLQSDKASFYYRTLKSCVNYEQIQSATASNCQETIKIFLREYVEEFGREDTEQIITRISYLPAINLDEILSDHKILTAYINSL